VSWVARILPTNADISSRVPSSTNSSMQWWLPSWLWKFEATVSSCSCRSCIIFSSTLVVS